ncbi:protein gamma response 1 isoform X2 [Tasmannia lanceolata]|uniref:protein gamma response 1 isoform X2 n=1 Tax=Tasmannia lanceolata TaxID=3420 RepID=UPI004062A739
MELDLQSSTHLEYSFDNDDSKYFAGLSTILVATIQEVKDRISQIEFIFCSQLFPNFQLRSKTLHKRLAEARKAAEDDWKEKEKSLLCQIEDLQLQKHHAQGQALNLSTSLEQEKAKLMTNEKLLHACETEKTLLLAKLESLEKHGADLQVQLRHKTEEVDKGKEVQEKLLQQVKLLNCELSIEKEKRKGTKEGFLEMKRRLKKSESQYQYLLGRYGLTSENKLLDGRMEAETDPSTRCQNQSNSSDAAQRSFKPDKHKNKISFPEKLEDDRGMRSIQNTKSHSTMKLPSTSHEKKSPIDAKSGLLLGLKRPIPYWRDTRSRQEPGGADPHDDFLDTPLENVRENINKAPKEEVQDFPVPPPEDMDFNNSDDETQQLDVSHAPQRQQCSISRPESRGFKYVEPVRKKVERQNLKGVECKQCKKFYDAVLPIDGKEDPNNSNGNCNIRCEHHDGVSRHRYKYLPPMTPEGFWNIGFDSDM